jgi:hypothetical protein
MSKSARSRQSQLLLQLGLTHKDNLDVFRPWFNHSLQEFSHHGFIKFVSLINDDDHGFFLAGDLFRVLDELFPESPFIFA